jgi:tRNA(fMet)-specific endonuclease VapC
MFMLDTDTIVYLLKGNRNVTETMKRFSVAPKAVSVITYGELTFGAYKSQHVHENLAKVHRIREIFPILHVTPAVMETYGEIKSDLQKKGIPLDDMDLIIGATALTMGYCLVTNNAGHFDRIPGLNTVNWSL